jgi:hypothetical protein
VTTDSEHNEKLHTFVAYWDCLGFETIFDMTSYERTRLLEDLTGRDPSPAPNLQHMTLRARFNPQRNPEIWVFNSTVDVETLRTVAEENPQSLVDLIRANGTNVFRTTPAGEQRIK